MATMSFSGKNLDRVRDALVMAVLWNKNEVGTCPDVVKYKEDLDELEAEITQLEALLTKIDRKLSISP